MNTMRDEIKRILNNVAFNADDLLAEKYFIIDFSSCEDDDERMELISYYLSKPKFSQQTNVFHGTDIGYLRCPPEFTIVKVIDEDEFSSTYKRHWTTAILDWNGIIFTATILYHLHDGWSGCHDETWVYV